MSNIACRERNTWEDIYAECIAPNVAWMDNEEYERCRIKILELYNEFEDVPTVTDVFYRTYDYNAEIIERGLRMEIENNPDFREIKKLLTTDRKQAEEDIEETIDEMMQTVGYYELYDFIVDILVNEKLSFEIFDSDDFQWLDSIEAEEIFGKGSKIIVNNCQNTLLEEYNKIPKILTLMPKNLTGILTVVFSPNQQINSMPRIGGNV